MGHSVTDCHGETGIMLDPPYNAERNITYSVDDKDVSSAVREWAIQNGDNKNLRIALCGYAGEHDMPQEWTEIAWKAHGGYAHISKSPGGLGRENAGKERIWFSPHCLRDDRSKQLDLFQGENR